MSRAFFKLGIRNAELGIIFYVRGVYFRRYAYSERLFLFFYKNLGFFAHVVACVLSLLLALTGLLSPMQADGFF